MPWQYEIQRDRHIKFLISVKYILVFR
uniref:Uncharacterized protein n=1 Tax=Anguilla anguilla TaxID=7936 RepID=A0A0E9SU13_ANGAN